MGETSDRRMRQFLTGSMGDRAQAPMRAKVDNAQTTDENKRHWGNADSFSADVAYDTGTRQRLRNRARYESTNNCYAKNVRRSAADDLIGTGPHLQLYLPGDGEGEQAKDIERAFALWIDATQQAIKLRIAEQAVVDAGESFGIFGTNQRLRNPVKFDLLWVEAEMCTSPYQQTPDPRRIDGIDFDDFGNPERYWFLRYHPGGLTGFSTFSQNDFYSVPAERVVHWYPCDRHGQHRGIPELTPALGLYGQLRRYTLANLTAAEFAATLAGVLKTDAPAEEGNLPTTPESWDLFEMVRGALLTLPQGWEANQFKTETPHTGYAEFKRELLNESGCATGHPLNRVTGNSSGYNYSSGRLDHLPYQRRIRIKRNDLRLKVLDPILREWWIEATLVGIIPASLELDACRWCWNWDGFDSIDQNKDAQADDMRLKNGTATYAEILAEYGQDWTEVFQQIAKEKSLAAKLGMSWPIGAPAAPSGAGAPAAEPVSPENVQDAVAAAFEEANIAEDVVAEVMAKLEPAFAALRNVRATPSPSKNGTAMANGA